jgi:hypothetical protein
MRLNTEIEIISAQQELKEFLKRNKVSFKDVCVKNSLHYRQTWAKFFQKHPILKTPIGIDFDKYKLFVKLVDDNANVEIEEGKVVIN